MTPRSVPAWVQLSVTIRKPYSPSLQPLAVYHLRQSRSIQDGMSSVKRVNSIALDHHGRIQVQRLELQCSGLATMAIHDCQAHTSPCCSTRYNAGLQRVRPRAFNRHCLPGPPATGHMAILSVAKCACQTGTGCNASIDMKARPRAMRCGE